MFYVECPHCQHMQVLRWGDSTTPGGMKWDTNDVTRPGGQEWDFEEVKKTVRYECERCVGKIMPDQATRRKLLATGKWIRGNPKAPSNRVSFHLNQLYPIWNRWEGLVEEFLRAQMVKRDGNTEPLKSFVQYVLGEPWKEIGMKAEEEEIAGRFGDYKMGEPWPYTDESSITVFTVDVQMDHVWLVARTHKKGIGSGLVWCGRLPSLEDVREKQIEMKVHNRSVWIDARYNSQIVYEACLRYGWNPIIGEDDQEFTHRVVDSQGNVQLIKKGWRRVKIDPFEGRNTQGKATIVRYSWSNPFYKDRLYLKLMRGLGILWQVPKDVPRQYLRQIQAEERREVKNTRGVISYIWHRINRDNHMGDCECMHVAVADMAGLTRVAHVPAVDT